MSDTEQSVNRSETAILEVFDNQFPTLTNQLVQNLRQLSVLGERWPALFLLLGGAALLVASLAIKIGLFGLIAMGVLWPGEFMTLILAGAGLMLAGGLFSVYQSSSLRRIIKVQQALGTELLNKQIDIGKDLVMRNQDRQWGQLILLPTKKRRRFRR